MDATDHENLPNASQYCGLSGWIHVGFDYLGHDSKIMSTPINFLKNESERKHHTGARSLKGTENKSVNSLKQNFGILNDRDISGYSVANSSVDLSNSENSSPVVTPQTSPSTRRKMDSSVAVSSSLPSPTYNPLVRICKGFFNAESNEFHSGNLKTGGNFKKGQRKTVCTERRKFIISNFDINALSPTSW